MDWHDPNLDQRVRRTRENVLQSFAELARERPYDEISVSDVLDGAAVGRSTFYAHYHGKDDVFRAAFAGMYSALADCLERALRGEEPARLVGLVAHFDEQRTLVRRLTTGPATEAYQRSIGVFADMLAERLDRVLSTRDERPRLPVAQIAASLAHAELALVMGWLADRSPERASDEAVAHAMSTMAVACVDALAR